MKIVARKAARGEKDMAFAELNKSYESHECFMMIIKVAPPQDARFADLVRRVGLPQ